MKSKMLGNVFALVLMSAMVSSCEKMVVSDGALSDDAEDANVVLRVGQFEQISFGDLTRAEVANLCTRLTFLVYKSDGEKVKTVNQKYGDSDFGAVSLSLAEGTYELCVFAHSSNGNPVMSDLTKIKFENSSGFSDTFFYSGQLKVSEEKQDKSISLRRITSLFRFVIEDDFPQNVRQLRFYYTGGSGAFDAATGYGSVNSKQSVFFEVDGSQKQFDLYTILKDETGNLKFLVTAYDANSNVIKEQEFTDVPMQRNMITKYTGSFFSGVSGDTRSSSFTVQVDDTWAGETPYSY